MSQRARLQRWKEAAVKLLAEANGRFLAGGCEQRANFTDGVIDERGVAPLKFQRDETKMGTLTKMTPPFFFSFLH